MRQFMMTMIALTASAATMVTAQAENHAARPSQTVSAAAVYSTGARAWGRNARRLGGRC
jgi:hypothetical protein